MSFVARECTQRTLYLICIHNKPHKLQCNHTRFNTKVASQELYSVNKKKKKFTTATNAYTRNTCKCNLKLLFILHENASERLCWLIFFSSLSRNGTNCELAKFLRMIPQKQKKMSNLTVKCFEMLCANRCSTRVLNT